MINNIKYLILFLSINGIIHISIYAQSILKLYGNKIKITFYVDFVIKKQQLKNSVLNLFLQFYNFNVFYF